jgi:hypothetical protein
MPLAYSGVTVLADIEPHKFLEASSTPAVQLPKTTVATTGAKDDSNTHKSARADETLSSVSAKPQSQAPRKQSIAKLKFTSKKADFERYVSTGLMKTTAASIHHN